MGAALVSAHGANVRQALRVLGEYAVARGALMLPYVRFVRWREGIGEHLHEAIAFAKGEAHQRFVTPPAFPFWTNGDLMSWSRMDAAVFLFYAAHALAIVCFVFLARSTHRRAGHEPVVAAGFAMLLLDLLVVLRHPIESRNQDGAALHVVNRASRL